MMITHSIFCLLKVLVFCAIASSTRLCSIQLSHSNSWKVDTVSRLRSEDSVSLCLPLMVEEVAPQTFDDALCRYLDFIGNELLTFIMTTQGSLPSASRVVTGAVGKQKRGELLCRPNSTASLTYLHGDLVMIKQVDYTTRGGILNEAYNISMAMSSDTPDILLISKPGLELPAGNYQVRSYSISTVPNSHLCMDMGMAMVMYMRGFRMSTSAQNRMLPCLSYYFGSWILRDKGHFWGAMWYSFLLALLTQGLSAIRAVAVQHVRSKKIKKITLTIVYVVQQFMGYLIMLIAMMYSVELLLAVVVGLMIGNQLFVKGDRPLRRRNQREANDTLQDPLLGTLGVTVESSIPW